MYMPILRGKRFELLALRDMAESYAAKAGIVPIIEPVKSGTVGTELRRAIDAWIEAGGSLGVVVNPGVGEIKSNLPVDAILDELAAAHSGEEPAGTESVARVRERLFPVLAVSTDSDEFAKGLNSVASKLGRDIRVALWLRDNVAAEVVTSAVRAVGVTVSHLLASESRVGKRISRDMDPAPGVVVFADQFPGKTTNAEYPDQREQVFTEEHLYFRDDGLAGFSDFGTIGDDYRDGGGAPKYVVVHWTYQRVGNAPGESPVYLQHFCSDEQSVVAPVQTKYAVAADKLVAFCDRAHLPDTPGLRVLRDYHDDGRFPGLGMLKKISIMNHLAVVDLALGDASL